MSDSQNPLNIPICRTRGDTRSFTFELRDKDTSAAIDITGRSYLLTVNSEEDPSNTDNELFQLTGTVDGPNGKVTFSLSTGQADQTPGEYYYDLQETGTDSSIKTRVKSTYTVSQDITK